MSVISSCCVSVVGIRGREGGEVGFQFQGSRTRGVGPHVGMTWHDGMMKL